MPRTSLPVAAGAAGFALLAVLGCNRELVLPVGDAPPPAAAPAPEPGPQLDPEGYLGIVAAGRSIDIVAPEAGTLASFSADLGDFVQARQMLAKVDAPELEHEKAMALAQVGAQRAAAAQYGAAARRAGHKARVDAQLAAQGYVAANEAFDAQATGAEARAAVGAAAKQAHVHSTQVDALDDRIAATAIAAPFSGRIAARYVDPGATVVPGTKLMRLVAEDRVEVRFAVPEAVAPQVRLGAVVKLCADGNPEVAIANVVRVSPEVDAASGMVFFEAALDPDATSWLRTGTRVRVHATLIATC